MRQPCAPSRSTSAIPSSASGYGTRTYRVVGRVVFPSVGEVQPLADGALFTADGVRPLLRKGGNESHYLLVKYEPGANGEAIERALARQPQVRNVSSRPDITSVEVGRLGQIDAFPAILAALLAILALVAVGHTLVTSVRRRRRELALLKTFGFRRRQVGEAVAWQATTVAVIGLVAGIPIGLVAGRLIWRAVADSLGVAVVAELPVAALTATAVSALVLVNVIAFLPCARLHAPSPRWRCGRSSQAQIPRPGQFNTRHVELEGRGSQPHQDTHRVQPYGCRPVCCNTACRIHVEMMLAAGPWK